MGVMSVHRKHDKKVVDKFADEIKRRTAVAVTGVWIMTLHDKEGYGKKRLERVLNEVMCLFESIDINCDNPEMGCSFGDILKTCKEEFGIDLK